ncbi:hypothetical protein TH66_11015 [Carbonactinospora thermoautotrophica]|uniref:Uncharacterized protein n=1 Tax=Carbonactinospora thermoautotrophica TaxID=1469144 RepID=A0A132N8W3_9ACTN|nr:hypothetical protein LI90_3303 [Carbonactinospora thermoautotrophica]KWX03434.1 hypothetical protein TH66_11015 [Carbonactinospora thermoautotrophica]KWX06568.1 hypothetical protein TR74_21690 [Carbonactinospora thermoautotrophica]
MTVNPLTWPEYVPTGYAPSPWGLRRAQPLTQANGSATVVLDENQTDRWWFLECDPNGQWAFAQDKTGMPIAAAFADLLTAGRA